MRTPITRTPLRQQHPGLVLLQVLVIALLLIIATTAILRWQLNRYQAVSKQENQSRLEGKIAGLAAYMRQCLATAGYPSASCTPNAAQAACIPSGLSVAFSGTPPACELKTTATD
ncbi:MAG: hypothetical protein A2234_08125 [Elusimicrobia bacterium RIFOXYA2_FULL_58_8]|nr:MAG: hypothetical protein A2285_08935 [Elusimicrobia bacterium RIFOXYA12_FULL_57_11]OGS15523.1 MAG: hypothetical protein A2234_08125 [Elusimicrobia bacterium RIFOXYA2_FULL_58_8]